MDDAKNAEGLKRPRGRGKGRMNPGDVANHLVRCMLADASEVVGSWTEEDRERTLEYFEYRCAFTGMPYDPSTFVWDHLIPHNKEACGLHIYGNLVPATKAANSAKEDKNFSDFLRDDHSVLADTPASIRAERIRRLEDFRRVSGYQALSEGLGGLSALCTEQYERVKAICKENKEAVRAHLAPLSSRLSVEPRGSPRRSQASDDALPIDYEVTPPAAFLARFLKTGIAFIEEHYRDGRIHLRQWEARKLTPQSNLVGNIRSRPGYRAGQWQAAGLDRLVLRLTPPTRIP